MPVRQERLVVFASSEPTRLRRSLELTGLSKHFGSNLFSASMVDHGKPEPDLFLHAAAVMNAAPERSVVIEDSTHGVAAGRSAGMTVIGFTGASHCPPDLAARLELAGAHHVVRDAAALQASLDLA